MILKKLDYNIYQNMFNGKFITPLKLNIDLDLFKKDIDNFKHYFRVWGENHLEFPRFGISLVNQTGSLDDEIDPACYPLDEWWKKYPGKPYWDHDFIKPTPLLNCSCFDVLNSIKPYMIRSNILLWHNTGHFKPHVDMIKDRITHLRLWGVSSKDYKLIYENGECTDWEPGKLYLIDTVPRHWAEATGDNVYTFFIAVRLTALDVLYNLME